MTPLNKLPSHIVRTNDNEIFTLAENGLYYIQKLIEQFPTNIFTGYKYERLINDWEDGFKVATDGQIGPKIKLMMQPEEMVTELAKLDAPRHCCCRCDSPADRFQYGAFFCTEECAERVSDYTLDDGQQMVPDYLHDLHAISDIENAVITEENEDKYKKELSKQTNGRIWKASAFQKAEAILKTLYLWRDHK